MRAPGFWSGGGGIFPLLLSPIAAVYAGATARRMAAPGMFLDHFRPHAGVAMRVLRQMRQEMP
jgi:hypothetical protein